MDLSIRGLAMKIIVRVVCEKDLLTEAAELGGLYLFT